MHKECGFAVVEILVGLAILTVLAVGGYTFWGYQATNLLNLKTGKSESLAPMVTPSPTTPTKASPPVTPTNVTQTTTQALPQEPSTPTTTTSSNQQATSFNNHTLFTTLDDRIAKVKINKNAVQ